MKNCYNHPERKAFSICHNCGRDYCEECLTSGIEYYYCGEPECQKILNAELSQASSDVNINCPQCGTELEISADEKINGIARCPECDAVIDIKQDPPVVLDDENYDELMSVINQVDIGIIKSMLDDSNIDYYVFGENFLSMEPLLQPVRFFVNQKQIEEAKELLKDYKPNIWGASSNQY